MKVFSANCRFLAASNLVSAIVVALILCWTHGVRRPHALNEDSTHRRELQQEEGFVQDGYYVVRPPGGADTDFFTGTVYCDQTNQGGGWTLFAHHAQNEDKVFRSPVSPCEYGVVEDQLWRALVMNMQSGMYFTDDINQESVISKSTLESGNCNTPNEVQSLQALDVYPRGVVLLRLWQQENSGCDGSGQDYSAIVLGREDQPFASSLYNFAAVKFDVWGYGSAEWSGEAAVTPSKMRYYIK